eukprot:snap_masked-scaffold_6-processed-gene-6.22-mRNA-1 protein AED:1.00 eAED:1.00 QI:0/-1/0/0/-1/1/1/0/349
MKNRYSSEYKRDAVRRYRIRLKEKEKSLARNTIQYKKENTFLLEKAQNLLSAQRKLESKVNNGHLSVWLSPYLLKQNEQLRRETEAYRKYVFLAKKLQLLQSLVPKFPAMSIFSLLSTATKESYLSLSSVRVQKKHAFHKPKTNYQLQQSQNLKHQLQKKFDKVADKTFKIRIKSVSQSVDKNILRFDYYTLGVSFDHYVFLTWKLLTSFAFDHPFHMNYEITSNVLNLESNLHPAFWEENDDIREKKVSLTRLKSRYSSEEHFLVASLTKFSSLATITWSKLIYDSTFNSFTKDNNFVYGSVTQRLKGRTGVSITATGMGSAPDIMSSVVATQKAIFSMSKNSFIQSC